MPGFFRGLFDKGQKPAKPAVPAQLIASLYDFQQALRLATPEEAESLREGQASRWVVDQIGAAIAARLILAKEMSQAELIRYVQHLQNRYSVAVGPTTYARYKDQIPQGALDDKEKLWAELQTLSYRLRLAYSVSHTRDHYLAQIRTWCFIGLIVCLVFAGAAISAQWIGRTSWAPLNIALVGTVGLAGGLTSIARRGDQLLAVSPLEEDPVVEASALQQGQASLLLAAVTGPIFALTLLLIFWSTGLKVGDLTPTFINTCPDPGKVLAATACHAPDFQIFKFTAWLRDGTDAAKLGLWAFIAGFAEQLVPDVLDQFAKQAEAKKPLDGKGK